MGRRQSRSRHEHRTGRHRGRLERPGTVDRRLRREARRGELLDAAVEAIRSDGSDVSMETIAAQAGITKPILYRHFTDREGLVDALADRFATSLQEELAEALGRAADDPQELLRAGIDAFLGFVESDPEVYGFLTQRVGAKTLSTLVTRVAGQVAVVIGERLRELGRDSGAAEPWAFGIVGMVHLAGHWWIERRTMPRARLVSYLTELLWSGLERAGTESTTKSEGRS